MTHYRIKLADVLAAHDEALTYGGRAGVLSLDSIESAIGRPYSGYHHAIYRKSASLLHAIIQNHGFVDGYKRTALIVTLLLIERSGYRLMRIGDERIDDLVVAVADGKIGFDPLSEWFKVRITRP